MAISKPTAASAAIATTSLSQANSNASARRFAAGRERAPAQVRRPQFDEHLRPLDRGRRQSERVLEMGHGLVVRGRPHGLRGRAAPVVGDLVEGPACSRVVARQLGEHGAPVGLVHGLDGAGEGSVQPRPSMHGDRHRHAVSHDGVFERVDDGAVGAAREYPGGDQLVDGAAEVGGREAGRELEHLQVDP